jgi:ABC-type multidrug transport system fused ATPase/permease subunit
VSALPAATAREIRAYARRVIRAYPRDFGLVACLEALAATAGLFVPWLLGELVADVSHGHDTVLRMVALICLFLVGQAVLVRLAGYAAAALGEKILAGLRDEFVSDLLALRPEVAEDADVGDLITRTTRDCDQLSTTVRAALPATMTAVGVILFTLGALCWSARSWCCRACSRCRCCTVRAAGTCGVRARGTCARRPPIHG